MDYNKFILKYILSYKSLERIKICLKNKKKWFCLRILRFIIMYYKYDRYKV